MAIKLKCTENLIEIENENLWFIDYSYRTITSLIDDAIEYWIFSDVSSSELFCF